MKTASLFILIRAFGFGNSDFFSSKRGEITHLHMRPVQLLNVEVINVQTQLLLTEFTRCDAFKVCTWAGRKKQKIRQKEVVIMRHFIHKSCTHMRSLWLPEPILERSHLLMHSWWTYCRLPIQRHGWIRGLDEDSSPIWQIRHRSPSSSSESSSNSLNRKQGVQIYSIQCITYFFLFYIVN